MIKQYNPIEWIRESNLIEDVDDAVEDQRCLRAWKWLDTRAWNLETILGLHRRIMWKHKRSIAGKLRTCNVKVGGFVKMPWQKVSKALYKWLKDYKKPRHEADVRQAHIAFEEIHPFVDGNGRTGRHIMNWQRVRLGLQPLCIKASERGYYYRWFREDDELEFYRRLVEAGLEEKFTLSPP